MSRPAGLESFDRGGHAILRLRPSLISYWRAWLACAAVIGIWFILRQFFDSIATALGFPAELSVFGLLVVGLVPILISVAFHRFTRSFEIEDNSVLRTTIGLVSRVQDQYTLSDKIQIKVHQSVLARFLGFGTLVFSTGNDRSKMVWANISSPDQVVSFIRKLNRKGISGGVTPPKNNITVNQSAVIPDVPPSIPKPPEGTKFASHVVVLPPVPDFVDELIDPMWPGRVKGRELMRGGRQVLVQHYQWIERGEPLYLQRIGIKKGRGFGFLGWLWWKLEGEFEMEYIEVSVPSPATGLLLMFYQQSGWGTPYNWKFYLDNSAVWFVLPVLHDPLPESGSFLFGNINNAFENHRQFLLRGKDRSNGWLAENLSNMCALKCDIRVLDSDKKDWNFIHLWLKNPDLRPCLDHLVDEGSIQEACNNVFAIEREIAAQNGCNIFKENECDEYPNSRGVEKR